MRIYLLALFAMTAFADVVTDVRIALQEGNPAQAQAFVSQFRKVNGNTPEALAALSWVARGALDRRIYQQALTLAEETEALVKDRLKTHKLDEEENLPTALGAAIEVHGQALAAQGRRTEAVAYLRQEVAQFNATSIRARINKNINLLSLEGKAAPPIRFQQWLGPKPVALAQLKGKPTLLFFWAHWCGDCKGEAPILARLAKEFGPQGLVLIGPTQRYGYAAQGQEATPAAEVAYIDQVRKQYYGALAAMPVPVDEDTFRNYGASTTPTLVLIDKAGIVRLYHPGALPYDQLAAKIKAVISPPSLVMKSAGTGR